MSSPAAAPTAMEANKSARATTTTTTTTVTTEVKRNLVESVARVEDLGRQAQHQAAPKPKQGVQANQKLSLKGSVEEQQEEGQEEGNKLVTTLSTIAAQSGSSRIVVVVLKDGQRARLKLQEMRPAMFEVGSSHSDCLKYLEEHQRLLKKLRCCSAKESPVECWLRKYHQIGRTKEPQMSLERKMVYMCMLESLQGCWKSLMGQLERRWQLLEESSNFYESCQQLVAALDRADRHVQLYRQEFLEGATSGAGFQAARLELEKLQRLVSDQHQAARRRQTELLELIESVGSSNLGDVRANHLIPEASQLIKYIGAYLLPLERRRLQLDQVITTTTTTTRHNTTLAQQQDQIEQNDPAMMTQRGYLREISNFNDLDLVEQWLSTKLQQLNSSLLTSLGVGVQDSRSILNKHEQIALECRAIEEATLTFNGRSIHALRQVERSEDRWQGDRSLFQHQKALAQRVRDVITILDARLVLLRRSIDFYLRAKESTGDINRMLRRLQVDNSLQSVQFVANELESRDVSSVVASGATIISELQQLQLAQQHGQRSRLVSLELGTNGIRANIDQLQQDLAHLKTVLSQRRLVLLNEDASKMASNFAQKCHQLHQWLQQHVCRHLGDPQQQQVPIRGPLADLKHYCDQQEHLRVALQNKTLEVEALLRSLSTLAENIDGHHHQPKVAAAEIQRATDELRQDWIQATNCLDRRLDLARKYLAIQQTGQALASELGVLERTGSSVLANDRTEEEMRANANQLLAQLGQQVRNFSLDAEKNNTELAQQQQQQNNSTGDINKRELVAEASELMDRLQRRLADTKPGEGPGIGPINSSQPAHRRPQQLDPPRFTRPLASQRLVEPFSQVELECETDQDQCQVDWFLGPNFKRIPTNIKHSTQSEGNLHRLVIAHFGPVCCGTYLCRASNQAGQALTQCQLRLMGIQETAGSQDDDTETSPAPPAPQPPTQPEQLVAPSPANFSTTSSFSQWRQVPATNATTTTTTSTNKTIERIIQSSSNEGTQLKGGELPLVRVSQTPEPKQKYTVESPVSSATLPPSRSVSKSPFEVAGSPQAPVFVQDLTDSMARSCSRANLVCVVVGNPPPTIEWLHNNQTIATAKCQRNGLAPAAPNFCKLTIETANHPRNQGQYVCRASNRAGQTTTGLTLTK